MAHENYINHVVLVLDASASMGSHARNLIKVADGQIEYLARRSKELDQETRVSVYTFNNNVTCLIYDKDVLRLPSISTLYNTSGMTALVDASIKALDDLSKTAQLYGDHAFLTFVLTDGQENRSRNRPSQLQDKLNVLPDNWTVAVLVPDQRSKFEAKGFGFPAENIAIWDTTTAAGITEVGETIRTATDNFMVGRSQGIRGTRSLFSTGVDAVNEKTVSSSLIPLPRNTYSLLPVDREAQIRDYITSSGLPYNIGHAFYQLNKTETIQDSKKIAIREKGTNQVYAGSQARQLLGLPNSNVRVKPDYNPKYDVFVQSTSINRKLLPGTDVLVIR